MGDEPGNLPGRTADRRLDGETRERLLSMLQEEIERASNEALAQGVPPEKLTAQLDERIARLRAQLDELRARDEGGLP
ncbi:hypothetical protein [Allorhizocola rhizosphaerae]|uniref:hypothetical protein n=1 Tax=Allorhizocola rhizosphaerae TaxID=1872709 RepID=UPI000E3D72F0|nr:hypothetical protein [Allorhizocola rhizosphaerae]